MNEVEIKEYTEKHLQNIERLKIYKEETKELKNKKNGKIKIIIGIVLIELLLLLGVPETIDAISSCIAYLETHKEILDYMFAMMIISALGIPYLLPKIVIYKIVKNKIKSDLKEQNRNKINIKRLEIKIKKEKEKILSKEIIKSILLQNSNIVFYNEYLDEIYDIIFNTPELLYIVKNKENSEFKNGFIYYLINKNKNDIINTRIEELINNNIKIEN